MVFINTQRKRLRREFQFVVEWLQPLFELKKIIQFKTIQLTTFQLQSVRCD